MQHTTKILKRWWMPAMAVFIVAGTMACSGNYGRVTHSEEVGRAFENFIQELEEVIASFACSLGRQKQSSVPVGSRFPAKLGTVRRDFSSARLASDHRSNRGRKFLPIPGSLVSSPISSSIADTR